MLDAVNNVGRNAYLAPDSIFASVKNNDFIGVTSPINW